MNYVGDGLGPERISSSSGDRGGKVEKGKTKSSSMYDLLLGCTLRQRAVWAKERKQGEDKKGDLAPSEKTLLTKEKESTKSEEGGGVWGFCV